MTVRYDIACDWDGVIYSFVTGFPERPNEFADDPVPGAINWLTECHMAGKTVVINSTRLEYNDEVTAKEIVDAMVAWLVRNGCPSEVAHGLHFWTDEGKPRARVYIDDRGYRFEGTFPSVTEMGLMDVWNRNERTKARAEASKRAEYEAQAVDE